MWKQSLTEGPRSPGAAHAGRRSPAEELNRAHRRINYAEGKRDTVKPTNCPTLADCEQEPTDWNLQGDGQALEMLLSRYSPALYRTALRLLSNPVDADDAVQDALMSAFKHISQFEGRCRISTWLTRIVINSARMQLRRRHRHETVSLDQTCEDDSSAIRDQLVDAGPSPEEMCERAELRKTLNELLKQLSPALCKAFQLSEIHGLSTLEAAQVLGTTESALKSKLLRARSKLRLLLRRALVEPGALRSQAVAGVPGVAFQSNS